MNLNVIWTRFNNVSIMALDPGGMPGTGISRTHHLRSEQLSESWGSCLDLAIISSLACMF